jgi:predicted CXXCH cytochrome family protein
MRARRSWPSSGPLALLAIMGLVACVDEKVVYRDGPSFAAPPAAAVNFVGYDDTTTKLTVCGNCHVGQQAKWKETAHASAWHTLDASGQKVGTCEKCHSVNNLGNAATDTAVGHRSTKDPRYRDVQCESCHNAGLQHVGLPQRGQMLASIRSDTGAAVTNGCGECHSGTHHPYVEDWRKSRHATAYTRAFNGATATAPEVPNGPRPNCQGCHIGDAVLANWGVNTNYADRSFATRAEAEGATCVVCHDPHGSGNPKQLRYPVDSRDPDNNLCVKCHNRRGQPDFSGGQNSPHAPHGPLLLGSAGWWPPGLSFEEQQGTHSSDRNPKLCAGCHLGKYDVLDKATGRFSVTVTGHRFLAIPCVNTNGAPTDSQTCTEAQRSFKSCAASGCHSEATARTAIATATLDIKVLYTALDQQIAAGRASGAIAATELASGKVSTARGATFNSNLAKMPGSEVHNPFLVKALLRASLAQVQKDYGVPSPIPVSRLAPYDQLILKAAPAVASH